MTNINPNTFTTRPEIEGTFGVVTTTHWIATAVGMAILEKGGNAFDAAVATAFALQVVEPHLNGPGGDVPVIVYDVRRGKPEVICGQGMAPAGATIAHYKSEGLDLVPGTGLLAACVPGAFETWMLLLRDYGTMPLADVLAPAIGYAQNGHPLLERANATIGTVAQLFREHWPTSAAVYLPNDEVPVVGSLFANKTLAATYGRIVKEAESAGADRVAQIERARRSWSHGFVAEAIDRFCRTQDIMDTSGKRHRGVLTADDMARWTPHVEAPLTYDYGRYTVCKTGPWGQGPVTLQQLALLKGFDFDGLDPTGADFIHLIVECAKLAYADREAFYGDPDFVEVPMATLLSDAYNSATPQARHRPGVARTAPRLDCGFRRRDQTAARGRRGAGTPMAARRRRADRRPARHRAATPCISTLSIAPATWCRRRRRAAGCIPRRSSRSSAFRSAPARRCSGSKRVIRRRLRPASGRAPRCRRPWRCATASRISPGARPAATARISGSRNFSCVTFTAGMNLQEAIDAPAWHSEHFPSSFWPRTARLGVLVVEGRVPKTTVAELQAPRPCRRGRPGLVGRPAHRGVPRRLAPPRRRQCARHAGLRGGAVTRFIQKFQQRGGKRRRLLQRRHMAAVCDDLQRRIGNGLRQQSAPPCCTRNHTCPTRTSVGARTDLSTPVSRNNDFRFASTSDSVKRKPSIGVARISAAMWSRRRVLRRA